MNESSLPSRFFSKGQKYRGMKPASLEVDGDRVRAICEDNGQREELFNCSFTDIKSHGVTGYGGRAVDILYLNLMNGDEYSFLPAAQLALTRQYPHSLGGTEELDSWKAVVAWSDFLKSKAVAVGLPKGMNAFNRVVSAIIVIVVIGVGIAVLALHLNTH